MDAKQIKSELKKLAKEANKHHQEVRGHLISALDHARQCGEFLIKAKKLVKHGQWQRWLRKNFSFSYETAADYMRVARYWNDPRMLEARQEGYNFTSIEGVLGFLREKRTEEKTEGRDSRTNEPPTKPLADKQKKAAIAGCNLRDTFNHYLPSLTHDERLMFNEIFNPLETGWWEKVVDRLHHLVCCKLEYDPYEYESSFDDYCTMLNENNVDEYLRYVKNHPQDGNNLFDRQRKFQMDELTTEVSRLKTVLALNKNRVSKKRLQGLRSKLTKRQEQLQKIEKFMEN